MIVQNTEANTIAHIHTDSKGTIQGLRATLTKPYKVVRNLKHKDILSHIIEETMEGKKMLVLEWVKGHETMLPEVHNWISIIKMQGNEWADLEAKKMAKEGTRDTTEIDTYEKYQLVSYNGMKIPWVDLAKVCQVDLTKQREQRLMSPVSDTFENGQGLYMWQSRKDRSLAFKTLGQSIGKREVWHYQALKYMSNRILTRAWIARMNIHRAKPLSVHHVIASDNSCPVCQLENRDYVQTKEHLWSGECLGTVDIVKEWKSDIHAQGVEMGLNTETIQEIIEIVEREVNKVNTQVHTLHNHGRAAVLMGMWSNDTIIGVKNTLVNLGWNPSKAMQVALKLMTTTQWIGLLVAHRLQYNYETFTSDITTQDISDMSAKLENAKSAKVLGLKYGKWNMEHSLQILADGQEGKAYIMDQASIQGITVQEVKINISKAVGAKRAKITKELNMYRKWVNNPMEALEDINKFKGKEGKKNKKRKRELDRMGLFEFAEYYTKDKPALRNIIEEPIQKSRKIVKLIESKQWKALEKVKLGDKPPQGTQFPTASPVTGVGYLGLD